MGAETAVVIERRYLAFGVVMSTDAPVSMCGAGCGFVATVRFGGEPSLDYPFQHR